MSRGEGRSVRGCEEVGEGRGAVNRGRRGTVRRWGERRGGHGL